MKNLTNCKNFSEYKKKLGNIIINNIGIPSLYDRVIIVETVNTGPNPKLNNIIEISCMEMMGGKITGYEFDAFLHPRYSINEVIKQKTNLNNNFYEEYYKDVYASDKTVLEQFKKFVKQSKIISFNANKEIDFINNEFLFHKISIFPKNKFYCALNIFNQVFPGLKQNIFSLNKCSDFLEIKLPKEKYHTSKSDCFAVAKIISKLYDIINDIKKYQEMQIQKNTNNINNTENYKINENMQNNSISGQKSDKSNKNSEIDFEYSQSFIDIIEEENRNDENRSENISINEKKKKNSDKSDKSVNSNKSDYYNELSEKNNKKFLNNKRKNCEFNDLLKNLRNKVCHINNNEINNIKNKENYLEEDDFLRIEKELLKKKEK